MFLSLAREIAAQVWCDRETQNLQVDADLTEAMAIRMNQLMMNGSCDCEKKDAVKWNEYNRVYQCHRCGHTYYSPDKIGGE